MELPDSVLIGGLSPYGRLLSFCRDRVADNILNGVRTAHMIFKSKIPATLLIACEVIRVWYPGQPKMCWCCCSEDHLLIDCRSSCCLNCEQPGHSRDDCPLPPMCSICLVSDHAASLCPYLTFCANVVQWANVPLHGACAAPVPSAGLSYSQVASHATSQPAHQQAKEKQQPSNEQMQTKGGEKQKQADAVDWRKAKEKASKEIEAVEMEKRR